MGCRAPWGVLGQELAKLQELIVLHLVWFGSKALAYLRDGPAIENEFQLQKINNICRQEMFGGLKLSHYYLIILTGFCFPNPPGSIDWRTC